MRVTKSARAIPSWPLSGDSEIDMDGESWEFESWSVSWSRVTKCGTRDRAQADPADVDPEGEGGPTTAITPRERSLQTGKGKLKRTVAIGVS